MRTYSIKDFDKIFPTDDACLGFLFKFRYPHGVYCQKCGKITKHYKRTGTKFYSCEFCGMGISPTTGTIFYKSDTPLRSWFHAIFLMSATKTGISAKQLERELGVTYKTAWRMFNQVRKLMAEDVNPLVGQVEVDETYIGGKRAGKRGRGASGKSVVMGMVERNGNAIAKVVPNVRAKTLLPMIEQRIARDNKTIVFTDELNSYNAVERLGYAHEVVQHAAKQYVRGILPMSTQLSPFGVLSSVVLMVSIIQSALFTFSLTLTLMFTATIIGRMSNRCFCLCWSVLPFRDRLSSLL